jgi:hypothetical protein
LFLHCSVVVTIRWCWLGLKNTIDRISSSTWKSCIDANSTMVQYSYRHRDLRRQPKHYCDDNEWMNEQPCTVEIHWVTTDFWIYQWHWHWSLPILQHIEHTRSIDRSTLLPYQQRSEWWWR